jgi:hypothetical protein
MELERSAGRGLRGFSKLPDEAILMKLFLFGSLYLSSSCFGNDAQGYVHKIASPERSKRRRRNRVGYKERRKNGGGRLKKKRRSFEQR